MHHMYVYQTVPLARCSSCCSLNSLCICWHCVHVQVLGLDTNNQFTKIIRVLLSRKLCVKEDMQDKLYKLDPKMRLGCWCVQCAC